MMEFLKENLAVDSDDDKSDQPCQSDTVETENADSQSDYLTVESRDKRIRRGTVLLMISFAAALLLLCIMIIKTRSTDASAQGRTEDVQIETAIARLTGIKTELFTSLNGIAQKFYDLSNDRQVAVHELQKNPFCLESVFRTIVPNQDPQDNKANTPADTFAAKKAQLAELAEMMQLKSISIADKSGQSCCMIDDTVLTHGGQIDGFRVEKIAPGFVELVAEDMKFVLVLPPD